MSLMGGRARSASSGIAGSARSADSGTSSAVTRAEEAGMSLAALTFMYLGMQRKLEVAASQELILLTCASR